jgi:hypothetical protein
MKKNTFEIDDEIQARIRELLQQARGIASRKPATYIAGVW